MLLARRQRISLRKEVDLTEVLSMLLIHVTRSYPEFDQLYSNSKVA
jgi:hypothetical protein